MALIRADAVAGSISAALSSSATSMESEGLADLPAISGSDFARLTLYRRNLAGRVTAKELVHVTAHAAGATTATILRAQAGTSARTWVVGDRWDHAITAADLDGLISEADASAAFLRPLKVENYATGGSGTEPDPWTSPSGTGGLAEAIDAAAAQNRPLHMSAGYYKITADVENVFDGLNVSTDGARTVIVGPDGTGNAQLRIWGTAGSPLRNVRFGAVHLVRLGSGGGTNLNISVEHADVVLGGATAEGGGNSILELRGGARGYCGPLVGWGGVDRCVFMSGAGYVEDFHVAYAALDDGIDPVDFHAARRCSVGTIYGRNCTEEVLDLGNSQYCHVGLVVAVDCSSALSCKTEGDDTHWTQEGSFGNSFGRIVSIGHTKLSGAVQIRNGAIAGFTGVQNYNTIHSMTIISDTVDAVGFSMASGPTVEALDNRVRDFWIKTDGRAIEVISNLDGVTVSDGYAESTGATNSAVFADGTSSDQAMTRLKIRDVEVRSAYRAFEIAFQGDAPDLDRCTVIAALTGFRMATRNGFNLRDPKVLSATEDGVEVFQPYGGMWSVAGGEIANCRNGVVLTLGTGTGEVTHGEVVGVKIHDVQANGFSATFDGGTQRRLDIIGNRIWNTGLAGTAGDAAISIQGSGSTSTGWRINDNRIYDTQATKTTNGYRLRGQRDKIMRVNNYVRDVLAVWSDANTADGANSVVANNYEAVS